MFIRKKLNKSGVISVQVIDKSSGIYKVIKTIGSSKNASDIERLCMEAKEWILTKTGKQEIDFAQKENQLLQLFNSIDSLKLIGIDLLLGTIFDEIGFNKIKDPIFKQLVLYRLVYPTSKLKTTEYLRRYQQINWDENKVYRYLDKLYNTQKPPSRYTTSASTPW